jgi:hypothetical protein
VSPKAKGIRLQICSQVKQRKLTSFVTDSFLDLTLNLALIHRASALRLEWPSVLASVEHAGIIHGLLERIALPAESVIGVSSKALRITGAEDERLSVCGPRKVIETSRIPQGLVGELGHTDGMRRGAGTSIGERISCSVEHVRLMVRGIDVLSVPATNRKHIS